MMGLPAFTGKSARSALKMANALKDWENVKIVRDVQGLYHTTDGERCYTIAEIIRLEHKSKVYIHRALQFCWLIGTLRQMENSKNNHWLVPESERKAWRDRVVQHTQSTPREFTGSQADLAGLQEFLRTARAEDIAKIRKSLKAVPND
jgi:hypothetical protein